MISVKIIEVKAFMAQLLIRETFDCFLLSDLEIQTANHYKINGRLNKKWYDQEESEELGDREYSCWKEMKSFAYEIIKGKKTPELMKIVFRASGESVEKIAESTGSRFLAGDVDGLFLNVRYEKGELYLITGTSLKTFTLDKTLEQEWDETVQAFLRQEQILFEASS